jgi:hypothetical protein
MVVPVAGLLWPQRAMIPVAGAMTRDWNPKSCGFESWDASGADKGIDIFAPAGRAVISAVVGMRIYRVEFGIGGNVVAVLGPKWRIRYNAHLRESSVHVPLFIGRSTPLGGCRQFRQLRGQAAIPALRGGVDHRAAVALDDGDAGLEAEDPPRSRYATAGRLNADPIIGSGLRRRTGSRRHGAGRIMRAIQ